METKSLTDLAWHVRLKDVGTFVAGYDNEPSARNDAAERNKRATELGTNATYEVVPRAPQP